MNVTFEKLEHNMAKITVTVEEQKFQEATVKAYQKNKSKFNIPGFRKGKASKAVIEKMYGVGVFYEEAVDFVLNDTYPDAAKETGLDIVSRPEIGIETLEAGKDFVYTATVAVKPEVTLGEYKGIKVEKAEVTVTAAEVNEKVSEAREKNARIVAVEDPKRKVKNDDIVTIDFEGFVDGKAFAGGQGTDYPLTIGSHSFVDTFEEQLIGHLAGDEVEVNVTFPEEYGAKELAGKPALFKVTVKEIKEKQLPDLDDEFASEVSEFETLKEYKASLKKELKEQKEKAAAQQNENNVVAAVCEKAEADIPDAMIDNVAENMLEDYAQRLNNQGIPFDQYMKITGQSEEALKDSFKDQAKKNIMTNLVLEAVADKENIEATEEDIEEQFKKMAEAYKMEVEKIKEIFGEGRVEDMKQDIRCQKAIDFLVAEAKLEAPKKEKKTAEKEDEE